MTTLQPHTIYPFTYRTLASRAPHGGGYVYGVQFADKVVKVGRTKTPTQRLGALVPQAREVGISPLRFFLSPWYANWGHVENGVLADMRAEFAPYPAPEGFDGATEWFTGLKLEAALDIARRWEAVDVAAYPGGRRRIEGVRASEVDAA